MKKARFAVELLRHIFFGTLTKGIRAISIDITSRCNLRCKHCYLFSSETALPEDLTERDFLTRLNKLKKQYPHILHATWVGGEPLLRKSFLEKGIELFPFNMVVTNGTIAFPKWKNIVFNVSVDGDRNVYKDIRGIDIFDRIMGNIENSDIEVNVACVISRLNYGNIDSLLIDSLLKECKKIRNINGVVFDFYTPLKGVNNDIWLNWKERDLIVEQLLKLRREYGGFILNSDKVLRFMLSENARSVVSNCPVRRLVVCLNSTGDIKKPCVIGETADCSKCGCVIPYMMYASLCCLDIGSLIMLNKAFC